MTATWYSLESTTMKACYMVVEVRALAKETWLCAGCARPKPRIAPLDAVLQAKPPNIALNFVMGFGIGVARKDFLFELGMPEVEANLILGNITLSGGTPVNDFVTFIGRHRIFVRGTTRVGFRICDQCGRGVYFATGQRYLYPAPPNGIEIFCSGNGGLVVSSKLYARIAKRKWKALYTRKLQTLGAPKDDLGELPAPI
jgi:hypothetical protein